MTTIEEINKLYESHLKKLTDYCQSIANSIVKSRLNFRIKNIRLQLIRNYYLRNLEIIKKRKEDQIKALNKKFTALLVGINYKNTVFSLNGCIQDVNNMTNYLKTKNITNDSIIQLTDDTSMKPTKNNIMNMFTKLLKDSKSGDNLIFYYSGHGSTIINTSENSDTEPLDDIIFTIDYKSLVDDELNEIINNNLKPDVNLFVLFDCCHSGTMLDLRYNYPLVDNNEYKEDLSSKKTLSNVYYISGCKDGQTSSETYLNSKIQGALTWSFLDTVNTKKDLSWKELVNNIREKLKTKNLVQIPQFSTGQECDVENKWLFV